jgi:hypothetical protein
MKKSKRNHSSERHSRGLAVEALLVGVLPRLARIDQRRLDALLGKSFPRCHIRGIRVCNGVLCGQTDTEKGSSSISMSLA